MKKYILILIAFLIATPVFAVTIFSGQQGGTGIGTAGAGDVNNCLKVASFNPLVWTIGTCGAGGSGGGTWSTTTSNVIGRLINYSNNNTDIINIGSNSTTTGKFWFDPNTSTSYLITANIPKLSNLTSNGFVKTSGSDGTLSTDTNTYLTGTGAGVTAVSVASANGFAGSSSGGATPALTLGTTITGLLKGNGTAISAGANGTDYTLITANTCSAGQHVSQITAAGVITCSADTGSGGSFPFSADTNFGQVVYSTSTPTLWFKSGLFASSTSYIDKIIAGAGTVGSPALQVTGGGGLYQGGVGITSLSNGTSGVSWDGTNFYPNTSNVKSLGISGTNVWNRAYINYASTSMVSVGAPATSWMLATSSLNANTLLFTNAGYPSVIVGADDSSPIANFEINSQSQGPYTSFGFKNDSSSGTVGIDTATSFGGISNNVLLHNNTAGGGSGLMIPLTSGNATAILRTYNGLGAIFNVDAPYQAAGTEPNVSMTMHNSDGGNNTLDLGLEDYPGTTPTGKQMYLHALADSFSTRMPVMSFGFWNQGCGSTSNATCSFGWLTASSTSSSGGAPGAVGTSTVIALGDTWTNGYSKGGGTAGVDYGVQGVADGTGATVQIVSTTTRSKALEVFKRSGSTFTSLLNVFNIGNVGISSSTPGSLLSIGTTNGINFYENATSTFGKGIDIRGGCFSINGTCLSSGTGLTAYDAFTHPATGVSATTSEMRMAGYVSTASSTVIGNFNLGGGNYQQTLAGGNQWLMQDAGSGAVQLSNWTGAVFGKVMLDGNPLLLNSRATNNVAIGTSTTAYPFNSYSATAPQLSLSAGAGLSQWVMRNAGGNLYFATTTVAGTATSSLSALEIAGGGFGTTTVRGLNISGQATSTSNVGFNLTGGCFSIGGTCIGAGGSGTVTSVDMTVPTGLTISGNPVTTSGTLAVALGAGYVIPLQTTLDGKLSSYDAFTHPAVGYSATTSAIQISSTATSTFAGGLSVGTTSTATLNSATFTVKGLMDKVMQIFTSAGTKMMEITNAGVATLLGTWDYTGAILQIPFSTDPTVNANGSIAINSTTASSSLRYYDGTAERALYDTFDKPTIYASSTLAYDGAYSGSATTTYSSVWNPSHAVSLVSLYCKTDVGTVWYEVGTGSASSTVLCTSSGAVSNTAVSFTLRQSVMEALGKQSTNPNRITVTPTFRYTAD